MQIPQQTVTSTSAPSETVMRPPTILRQNSSLLYNQKSQGFPDHLQMNSSQLNQQSRNTSVSDIKGVESDLSLNNSQISLSNTDLPLRTQRNATLNQNQLTSVTSYKQSSKINLQKEQDSSSNSFNQSQVIQTTSNLEDKPSQIELVKSDNYEQRELPTYSSSNILLNTQNKLTIIESNKLNQNIGSNFSQPSFSPVICPENGQWLHDHANSMINNGNIHHKYKTIVVTLPINYNIPNFEAIQGLYRFNGIYNGRPLYRHFPVTNPFFKKNFTVQQNYSSQPSYLTSVFFDKNFDGWIIGIQELIGYNPNASVYFKSSANDCLVPWDSTINWYLKNTKKLVPIIISLNRNN
ncbi:hypothetical protein ACR3K2_37520 [Cryptosporidium serpentis]